jgi:hypothetical protein
MIFTRWAPGVQIASPAYLDANILVGYSISGHRLYTSCALLVAQLLADGIEILFSHVAYHEALWAIARVAYVQATGEPDQSFGK